jgi:hypothetical protein
LGYKQGVKGTILYDVHSKEILISRHVVHHDHILPYKPCTSTTPSWHYHTDFTPSISQPELLASQEISSNTPPSTPTNVDPVTITDDTFPAAHIHTSTDMTPSQLLNETQNLHVASNNRLVRVNQTPSYLQDYECNHSLDSSSPSSKGILYPISDFHSCNILSPSHHAYTMSITHHS